MTAGIAVVLLAVATATAFAARPATPDEFSAIVGAVAASDSLPTNCEDPPAPLPPEQTKATVSDRDPTWAKLTTTDECELNDGWRLVHNVAGAWQFIDSGPEDPSEYCGAVAPTLPPAVGVDLSLCRRPPRGVRLRMEGIRGTHGRGWGRTRPKTIFNGGSPEGLAHHIRWRRWGKKVTVGRGLIAIYHPAGN